jgi:hypothetical protein
MILGTITDAISHETLLYGLKKGDLNYPLITGYNNHRASRLLVPLPNKAV